MTTLSTQAETAAKKLLMADETQLLEQLGMRATAIREDPAKAGAFDPQLVYSAAEMGLKEDVLDLGQRIFRRWHKEVFRLVCGGGAENEKDREELKKAFGVSDVAVAASLSALLITSLNIAPAIAVVVAALVVKRFFRPAQEEFCATWKKHVADDE